jgi:chemotaxis response regulator CheB/two-component sensor histidine kinase
MSWTVSAKVRRTLCSLAQGSSCAHRQPAGRGRCPHNPNVPRSAAVPRFTCRVRRVPFHCQRGQGLVASWFPERGRGVEVSGNSARGSGLFIVGVGVSARGVTALERLFRVMPADCGAAFVVVTHVGAHRETLLTEILARHSTMPVVKASHGQTVEPNHVYVPPSDAVLTISQRRLDLRAADVHQRERNPIDVFFASLARAAGENAVGIVLSGAGSDGSLGVKAIKEEGGLTIAQGHDQSGPAHSGMPSSAIATGLVDIVLPVDEIGAKLREFFRSFDVLTAAQSDSAQDQRQLVSVTEELQSTKGELGISKEELQSVNEELNTVNQELASKVDELRQSNADLRNLFESTESATVFLDRYMVIRSYTPAVRSLFNLISGDRGRPITDIAHQLEGVDLRSDIQRVFDERKPLERSVRVGDGDAYYLMRILPYRTLEDEIDGVLITFVNVSEVVAAEEQQRMLVAELNHRVRNMLQVVIGLANQTLHRSANLAEFEKTFMGRMQALARAYELLSRDSWRRVSMSDLIGSQLAAFATEGARCSVQGDAVEMNSNAALALGLVIYELATNATKYGSLSVPGGRVDVSWKMQNDGGSEPTVVVQWIESGGPEVNPPTRSGFGSELLNRQLRYELRGDAALEFHKAGVQATLVLPAKDFVVGKR